MLFYLLHHNVFDVTLTDIFQCVNTDNMTRRDPKENVQLTDELYLSECWILSIQYGGLFKLELLVTTYRLWILNKMLWGQFNFIIEYLTDCFQSFTNSV
jgi:hypothetical protein